MNHFGDPCVHCGVPHDYVPAGPCTGDPKKAVDISFCSLGVRHDSVERFVVKRSDGSLREHFEHISMGFGDNVLNTCGQKLRYDEKLQDEVIRAGWFNLSQVLK